MTTVVRPRRKPAHEHKPRSGRPKGVRYNIVEAAKASAAASPTGDMVDVRAVAAKLGLDVRHVYDRLLSYRRNGQFPRDLKIPALKETCVKCGISTQDTGKGDAYGHPGRLCLGCYGECRRARHREMAKRLPVGREKIATPSEAEANRRALRAEIYATVDVSQRDWADRMTRLYRTSPADMPKIVAAECLAEWRRVKKRAKAANKERKAS